MNDVMKNCLGAALVIMVIGIAIMGIIDRSNKYYSDIEANGYCEVTVLGHQGLALQKCAVQEVKTVNTTHK